MKVNVASTTSSGKQTRACRGTQSPGCQSCRTTTIFRAGRFIRRRLRRNARLARLRFCSSWLNSAVSPVSAEKIIVHQPHGSPCGFFLLVITNDKCSGIDVIRTSKEILMLSEYLTLFWCNEKSAGQALGCAGALLRPMMVTDRERLQFCYSTAASVHLRVDRQRIGTNRCTGCSYLPHTHTVQAVAKT